MTEVGADASRRVAAARRSRDYRTRRKAGEVVVPVPVSPGALAALERLGLLSRGERDPRAMGHAVARFLAVAPGMAAIGEALFRTGEESATTLPAVEPGGFSRL